MKKYNDILADERPEFRQLITDSMHSVTPNCYPW